MKEIVCVFAAVVTLLISGFVSAEEVSVKRVSTIPAKTSSRSGWNVDVVVIQVVDAGNGVICYGMTPTSDSGRALDGGYPGTAISCVKVR